MFRLFLFLFIFVLVGLGVEEANGQYYKKVGNKIFPFSTIVVDQSGNGHFTSIQSAIDSIPFYNRNWVAIRVKAGIYR